LATRGGRVEAGESGAEARFESVVDDVPEEQLLFRSQGVPLVIRKTLAILC
jgi:hypothetical protein